MTKRSEGNISRITDLICGFIGIGVFQEMRDLGRDPEFRNMIAAMVEYKNPKVDEAIKAFVSHADS